MLGAIGGALNSILIACLIILLRMMKTTPIYLTGLSTGISVLVVGSICVISTGVSSAPCGCQLHAGHRVLRL